MNDAAALEVLVVDDDELVRRMLVKVLERRGFVVHAASDGSTALSLLGSLDVDVVLLDQGLPDISGSELLVTLRADPSTATLPVILVTGQADIEARVGGLQAGADDYLVKPVNMDELVARVHAQIRGRDAWRSQVEDRLHERAQLAGSLAAIQPADDPESSARALVDVLQRIPGVVSVWVVAFSGDDGARVLAASRTPSERAEVDLDPLVLAEVRQAVSRGAVVLPTMTTQSLFGGLDGDAVALGVDVGGRTMAAVVIETGRQDNSDQRGAALGVLSAAIDFSPLVQRVLASSLEAAHGGHSPARQLRTLIADRSFHPVYQPLVELATGHITGFEALTRFDDGMPPDQRFAEAINAGLGLDLELATLERCVDAGRRLPEGCYLSVNVSATLMIQRDLGPVLDLAGGRPLVLELTEHERIDDYAEVRAAFEALGRGLRLSVDDAGSGWASMRHVFSLTPDFVKLDRIWVSRIHQDRARQALLLGMARFVSELQGVMVAEGIETHRELATLRSLGIEYGQGYLLGRPAPIELSERLDPSQDVMVGGTVPAV